MMKTAFWFLVLLLGVAMPAGADEIDDALAPHEKTLSRSKASVEEYRAAIAGILAVDVRFPSASADRILSAFYVGVGRVRTEEGDEVVEHMLASRHRDQLPRFVEERVDEILDLIDQAVEVAKKRTPRTKKGTINPAAQIHKIQKTMAPMNVLGETLQLSRLAGHVRDDRTVDALLEISKKATRSTEKKALDTMGLAMLNMGVNQALGKLGRYDGVMLVADALAKAKDSNSLSWNHASLLDVAKAFEIEPPSGDAKRTKYQWKSWLRKNEEHFPKKLGTLEP